MDTVRKHITRLESRIQRLNREAMENRASQEERNQLEAEIRAANSTLTHYRTALESKIKSLWMSVSHPILGRRGTPAATEDRVWLDPH